jgi:Toxin SymE, type I toxin-antitoxin system
MKLFNPPTATNILIFNNFTMKKEARSLTVSSAPTDHPRLVLTGAWLTQFGFAIGDKVSVTPVEPGTIIIRTEIPATVMHHLKKQMQLEQQLQAAEAELHYHRSKPQPCNKPTQP